jgi:tRNA splicing ligase
MISSFKHLTGTTFEVNATALLFNGKIAAIELEIPPNPSVPMPCNKFAHITVWCAADTEAYESNLLPEKVQCNEARHILFEEPVRVKGCFSFWYNET